MANRRTARVAEYAVEFTRAARQCRFAGALVLQCRTLGLRAVWRIRLTDAGAAMTATFIPTCPG
jgi:hypothetical protein